LKPYMNDFVFYFNQVKKTFSEAKIEFLLKVFEPLKVGV